MNWKTYSKNITKKENKLIETMREKNSIWKIHLLEKERICREIMIET